MRKALAIISLIILVSISVVAQTREVDRARRRFWVSMSLSSVFDTNISHDEQQISSFGMVPSLGFHFRDDAESPSVEVDYEVALHRYTNTDEYDRVSHQFNAEYRKEIVKHLYWKSSTEISLKGSSEDQEVNNNYIFEQQLQYRLPSNTRIAGFAAYRLKRYDPIEIDSNSIDSYFGAKIEQRLRGDRRVEFTYRYDHNRAWNPRNNYFRRKYSVEFETPLSRKRRDSILAEVEYAPRTYQNRTTRVNRIRVPRHDDRWTVEVTYERLIGMNMLMGIGYQYETRFSNDPDKLFSSNIFGVTFTFDKWSFR